MKFSTVTLLTVATAAIASPINADVHKRGLLGGLLGNNDQDKTSGGSNGSDKTSDSGSKSSSSSGSGTSSGTGGGGPPVGNAAARVNVAQQPRGQGLDLGYGGPQVGAQPHQNKYGPNTNDNANGKDPLNGMAREPSDGGMDMSAAGNNAWWKGSQGKKRGLPLQPESPSGIEIDNGASSPYSGPSTRGGIIPHWRTDPSSHGGPIGSLHNKRDYDAFAIATNVSTKVIQYHGHEGLPIYYGQPVYYQQQDGQVATSSFISGIVVEDGAGNHHVVYGRKQSSAFAAYGYHGASAPGMIKYHGYEGHPFYYGQPVYYERPDGQIAAGDSIAGLLVNDGDGNQHVVYGRP